MIFVISGTERFPFNRLIQEIDFLVDNNTFDGPVFIQSGSCTYKPKHCGSENFLPFDKMCEMIKKSELIIAHAGAGTTLLCLQFGKKPILVPRQKKFKEHVDDHQVVFAKKMLELGKVDVVFDLRNLEKTILDYNPQKDEVSAKNKLNLNLSNYLDKLIG